MKTWLCGMNTGKYLSPQKRKQAKDAAFAASFALKSGRRYAILTENEGSYLPGFRRYKTAKSMAAVMTSRETP